MHTGAHFPIENSNMFKEWQLEKKAIDDFRYIESEKEGKDIGQFRAEWVWWTRHQRTWRTNLRASGSLII